MYTNIESLKTTKHYRYFSITFWYNPITGLYEGDVFVRDELDDESEDFIYEVEGISVDDLIADAFDCYIEFKLTDSFEIGVYPIK